MSDNTYTTSRNSRNAYSCYILSFFLILLCSSGCKPSLPDAKSLNEMPDIYPDYTEITIPVNIAPLNFKLKDPVPAIISVTSKNESFRAKSVDGIFSFSEHAWRKLLNDAAGDSLHVRIFIKPANQWMVYQPFSIAVMTDEIDPYLVYRKIAPGYRLWHKMGIYERNLCSFNERIIIDNQKADNNCVNCHSFRMQDAKDMVFHQRSVHDGTYIMRNGSISKLKLSDSGNHAKYGLVYPYWHPSGDWIAFSSNDTKQDFHFQDPNRIEVFDHASDIVLLNTKTKQVVTSPILSSYDNFETFPCFSPDGKSLYFCSATEKPMPDEYKNIRYNLLRVDFDERTGKTSVAADTLYNAEREGRSAKFPRISPDGRFLMYTVSDYGNFSIWHRDADLCLFDLNNNADISMDNVNSAETESYHSFGKNSRWFVFSSRRSDGLYTHPYICYISSDGIAGKPFLLPQKNPDFYTYDLFSFNLPEFISEPIPADSYTFRIFTKTAE